MPACMYMEEIGATSMLVAEMSVGVTPEVNIKEHVPHIYVPPPSTNKAAHSHFETQRRGHQKFKTDPTKRTYVLQILKKRSRD